MGPRSILPSLITPAIYFLFLFPSCSHTYHYYLLRLILCKRQGRRDWQPLCTRWEQSYLYLCAGPRWLLISGAVSSWHLLVETGSLREIDPWYLCQGKTSATLHLKPSTWGNQRGARSHQAKFSGAVAGDSTLQDRGVARYLLPLLFSLVSLPFSFCFTVFYRKLQKKIIFFSASSPFCLVKHVRIWCFEGIWSPRFPSKGWRKYEEGMGQNFRCT